MATVVITENIHLPPPFTIRKPDVTEEQFFQWTTEDTNCELVHGELIMHSPASARHEAVFAFILRLLSEYVDEKRLGVVIGSQYPMKLAPGLIYAPDVMFIRKERIHLISERYLDGPADLVVEIVSPYRREHDLVTKRADYQKHGVSELWFVDFEVKEFTISVKSDEGYATCAASSGRRASSVLPGFWVEPGWLWQDPLPRPLMCLKEILDAS